jgi:asparagine synthase (glutamine-hydrolysing)
MCGITGILDFKKNPISIDSLKTIGNSLYHRGPDDNGYFIDSDNYPPVGLAHQRLSIIDLSKAGHQPMSNEDDTIYIVFNGEIYNFQEVRRECIKRGHLFKSNTDTETILHLYEDYGKNCVEKLDGMFAFAIWDKKKRILFLARDRIGKKPLFYFYENNVFCFGSEIKALLETGKIQPEVSIDNIPLYLLFGYVPCPNTLYKDIFQLPPASRMIIDASGKIQIETYWELKSQPQILRDEVWCVRKIRELLMNSVKKRLISDVPLGVFLSGGIDSSIVVGIMSQLMDQPVKTFSIGFEGDESYDETSYARIVAEHFNTDHTEFIVKPNAFELLDKLLWHHDEPYGDSSAIPTYIVSKLTRKHVTVALNGDGGDEVFAGYERFNRVKYTENVSKFMFKFMAKVFQTLPIHSDEKFEKFCYKASQSFPYNLMHWIANIEIDDISLLLVEEMRNDIENKRLGYSFSQYMNESDGLSILSKTLYINIKTYLLDDLLRKMDRMTMANSLEARSPFLDKDLIEFVMRLPDRMKIRKGKNKYLLKKTFSDLLPHSIVHRPKQGFGVPLDKWFKYELRDFVYDILLSPNPHYKNYINQKVLKKMINDHMNGKRKISRIIWTLLSFEMWLKNLSSLSVN